MLQKRFSCVFLPFCLCSLAHVTSPEWAHPQVPEDYPISAYNMPRKGQSVHRLLSSQVPVQLVVMASSIRAEAKHQQPVSVCPHVQVLQEVTGKPTLYYREGGTIPAMALLKKELGIDMTMFGFGLPDDRIHAPNERLATPESMFCPRVEGGGGALEVRCIIQAC